MSTGKGRKNTVKPPIKDKPKEDKPPNKGQAESSNVYTYYRKSPLKEDNLSTRDKTAGPKGALINCIVKLNTVKLESEHPKFRTPRAG